MRENTTRERIANIGAGMVPTYHATESVDEAKAVVESCRSATDELRRMLNEHGIEYDADDTGDVSQVTYWQSNGIEWSADGRDEYLAFDAVQLITPEQAIAATLESDSEYERKMDALLCQLTNGKFSKTRTYDLDFMESVVREEFETECVSESETCQMKLLWSNIDAGACFKCSACGGIVSTFGPEPRFCSKCGCRVEAVVK